MKTKIFLLLILNLTFIFLNSHAQSNIENISVDMVLIPENDPFGILGPDSFPVPRHAPTILVGINNTEEVTRIQSRVGTSSGAADLAEKIFDFETQGMFEDGTIYGIQGNTASLYFGSFYHQGTYYMQVRLERPDGTFSDWQEASAQ